MTRGASRRKSGKVIGYAAAGVLALTCGQQIARAQCSAGWLTGAGTIGSPGIGGNTARCLEVMPNGDVIVAGSFTTAGGVPVQRIARYSYATNTWAPVGTGATSSSNIYALAALPDGDILAGGNFSMIGGIAAARVARYDAQTGTYTTLGAALTGGGQVVAIQPLPNNEVIVGGTITQVQGPLNLQHIARYNFNTGVWSSMNSQMLSSGDNVTDLAMAPDGTVIVGGLFTNAGGSGAQRVARYHPTTNTWSALGGSINNGVVTCVLALPDGDVIAGGTFTLAGGAAAGRIARYNPGTNTWLDMNGGVSGGFNSADSLALMQNGDVVVGGTFTVAGGIGAARIARYRPSTNQWFAFVSGTNGDVNSVGVLPNGDAVCVGTFTSPGVRAARYRFGGDAAAVGEHPVDATGCVGASASFTAAGDGVGPFAYQWLKNGFEISYVDNPTANAATLVLTNLQLGDAGTYTCTVSTTCGSAPTSGAVLTVNETCCDSTDFNGDGLFPDTADIDDFLSVFSGGPCSTGTCGDTDFNNDGLFPDTLDIDSLLSVFSGGACL